MEQPTQFGRYSVVHEIGRGAMGVVYQARDPMLERTVAIKAIDLSLDCEALAEYEARFLLEARAAGGLNHPNIVTIYDVGGRSGGAPYIAMEFLQGRELKAVMATDDWTVERALEIAAQVADGLAYAHERGVVHRDIKPANIMILSGDRVKITDFGIARMRTAEAPSHSDAILGSPRYLSPERILQKPCDTRSDIFSLGVILYEMVTRHAPFQADDLDALVQQILTAEPPAPTAINPALSPMLDRIVAKALAKDADARYAKACELADDLRKCLRQGVSATMAAPARMPARMPAAMETASTTSEMFVDTIPVSIGDEVHPALPCDAPLVHPLASEFDSMVAIARLVAGHRGIVPNEEAAPSSEGRAPMQAPAVDGMERSFPPADESAIGPPAQRWSRHDRGLFFAGVAGAVVLGTAIVLV